MPKNKRMLEIISIIENCSIEEWNKERRVIWIVKNANAV